MALGVDVSRHQGDIDWQAAHAGGVAYAYVKLSEGIGYTDPAAQAHVDGARDAGVIPGGYHFARPDTNAPEADASSFAAQLLDFGLARPGCLPPCLDMERNAGAGFDYVGWSQRFIARVRDLTGYGPAMVYASKSWWVDRLGSGSWLDDQTWAWVAHYGPPPGEPGFKSDRTVMHQYTDAGRVGGYGGAIDENTCWVDLAQLTGTAEPTPEPPSPPAPSDDDIYVVQPGDTLSGIATKLDFPGGWQALYALNRDVIGPNADRIKVGQRLRVTAGHAPPGHLETYVVEPGDTLTGIAFKLHIEGGWQALYNANRDTISNPNRIRVGQLLRIPR